jgi:hypothetical protein
MMDIMLWDLCFLSRLKVFFSPAVFHCVFDLQMLVSMPRGYSDHFIFIKVCNV